MESHDNSISDRQGKQIQKTQRKQLYSQNQNYFAK